MGQRWPLCIGLWVVYFFTTGCGWLVQKPTSTKHKFLHIQLFLKSHKQADFLTILPALHTPMEPHLTLIRQDLIVPRPQAARALWSTT